MENLITFDELREIALKNGIVDNKVHIGIWAQLNGYIKRRILKNYKIRYYYEKINKKQ